MLLTISENSSYKVGVNPVNIDFKGILDFY